MDRERAENHLRLVAEAELRRATAHPRDGAPTPPDLPGAGAGALVFWQRSTVAEALYDLPGHRREAIALPRDIGGVGVVAVVQLQCRTPARS